MAKEQVVETNEKTPDTEVVKNETNESIPYDRFKQVNDEKNALKSKLDEFISAQEASKKKKLEEEGRYKELLEKADSEINELKTYKEKFDQYENNRRESLLSNVPEDEREKLSSLDLDTLEYVVTKVQNTTEPANPSHIPGANRNLDKKQLPKDWTSMDDRERRTNWSDIVKSFAKTNN